MDGVSMPLLRAEDLNSAAVLYRCLGRELSERRADAMAAALTGRMTTVLVRGGNPKSCRMLSMVKLGAVEPARRLTRW